MMSRLLGFGLLAVVVIALLGNGCRSSNPLAPFQPEVTNATDNFQLQATGVRNVTATLQYTWKNTGIRADINQACAISPGHASLEILDANLVQVYLKDLGINGTDTTITGTTGDWTIKVVLANCSGNLNFRVQKRI